MKILQEWEYWSYRPDLNIPQIIHVQCTKFVAPDGSIHTWVTHEPKTLFGNGIDNGNYNKEPGDFGFKTKAEAITSLLEHTVALEAKMPKDLTAQKQKHENAIKMLKQSHEAEERRYAQNLVDQIVACNDALVEARKPQ